MGRYYHGDIEGKFWFGVQSSTDAEFFGVEEMQTFFTTTSMKTTRKILSKVNLSVKEN